MNLVISLTWFLHIDSSLSHEGILKNRVCGACPTTLRTYNVSIQPKTRKIACGAFFHTTCNKNGMRRFYSQHKKHTMCHIKKNCTFCSTRWNVRTRMTLHGHVKARDAPTQSWRKHSPKCTWNIKHKEEWRFLPFSLSFVSSVSLQQSTMVFELRFFFWETKVLCHDWPPEWFDVNLNTCFGELEHVKKPPQNTRKCTLWCGTKVMLSKICGCRRQKKFCAARGFLKTALPMVVILGGSHQLNRSTRFDSNTAVTSLSGEMIGNITGESNRTVIPKNRMAAGFKKGHVLACKTVCRRGTCVDALPRTWVFVCMCVCVCVCLYVCVYVCKCMYVDL